MRLFRRRPSRDAAGYPVHYEHATQPLAASFLRAAAEDDLAAFWGALSSESQGLLEGRYASRHGVRLAGAAGVGRESGDERLREVATPLAASLRAALGGVHAVNAIAVSAARMLSHGEAFVLLLPRFAGDGFVREDEWRPGHLLGFVYEDREWKVDLGLTAELSADADLPDPLGELR